MLYPFSMNQKIQSNIFIALNEYLNIFVSLKGNEYEYEYLFEIKIFEYSSIQIFVLVPASIPILLA